MKQKANILQKAFILHIRAYRETSALVDLLTQLEGRICVIARGTRTHKSSLKGLLQPFTPLMVNFYGKGELPTLKNAESYDYTINLKNRDLLSGLYINELLMKVLPKSDPCEKIFDLYEETIKNLSIYGTKQEILRLFEKRLLAELGYGLQLAKDIKPDQYYIFSIEKGFKPINSNIISINNNIFSGESLLAINHDNYRDEKVLSDAKRLMRLSFSHLLEDKPLKTRELFTHVTR